MIIGIDPGPRESAIVAFDNGDVFHSEDVANHKIGERLEWLDLHDRIGVVAIEWIESFGMAVGASTFETVFAISSIYHQCQLCSLEVRLVPRRDVKMHLCQSPRAKDANIRQALIDRFGEVGTKKNPGPLFGISKHRWAALAIAATAFDLAETPHEATFHRAYHAT